MRSSTWRRARIRNVSDVHALRNEISSYIMKYPLPSRGRFMTPIELMHVNESIRGPSPTYTTAKKGRQRGPRKGKLVCMV